MIEAVKNYQIGKAYQQMIFNEAKVDPIAMLVSWSKRYSEGSKNPKKLKKTVDSITKLMKSDMANVEIMDKITSEFLVVAKQVENKEAENELSNILQKL